AVQIVIDTEAFFESRFERIHTRAARVDQSPVDIKKKQPLGIRHCELESRYTSARLGVKTNRRAKAPNKSQSSLHKSCPQPDAFGVCDLKFPWSLGFGVWANGSQTRRVHHQHGDHASEKYEQSNR